MKKNHLGHRITSSTLNKGQQIHPWSMPRCTGTERDTGYASASRLRMALWSWNARPYQTANLMGARFARLRHVGRRLRLAQKSRCGGRINVYTLYT